MQSQETFMSDEIAIGHLQKRKIEARVLIPFIAACREKFGDGPTGEAVAATVRVLAVEEGAKWAGSCCDFRFRRKTQ
jgi:hypothetical protein